MPTPIQHHINKTESVSYTKVGINLTFNDCEVTVTVNNDGITLDETEQDLPS